MQKISYSQLGTRFGKAPNYDAESTSPRWLLLFDLNDELLSQNHAGKIAEMMTLTSPFDVARMP